MMNYRFSRAAEADLADAVAFYDAQRPGLGLRFAVEVGVALAAVVEAPTRWPETEPDFHRYRLDHFPYALIYRLLHRALLEVVAVHDLRSRPGSWRVNIGS